MKKILFLMLIMGVFSPLINAYEYQVYHNPKPPTQPSSWIDTFYVDRNGILQYKHIEASGNVAYSDSDTLFFASLNGIKTGASGWIKNTDFQNIYKNDNNLLNDLYIQRLQPFLNYLYNNNVFGSNNYVLYDNYEILYNDDGLAVESIVEGVWAGLYDDSQKSKSGAMYNKNGSMVYYNGKEVTPVTSFLVWLQKFTNKVVIETFEEIQRSLISGIIAAVVLVLAIVRLVLELLPSSITPRRRRYYGGGRGSLPDYGDGSQVSASVRARLAAKNRALKARAYDRSGVEESTVNGILFDLENDR